MTNFLQKNFVNVFYHLFYKKYRKITIYSLGAVVVIKLYQKLTLILYENNTVVPKRSFTVQQQPSGPRCTTSIDLRSSNADRDFDQDQPDQNDLDRTPNFESINSTFEIEH